MNRTCYKNVVYLLQEGIVMSYDSAEGKGKLDFFFFYGFHATSSEC